MRVEEIESNNIKNYRCAILYNFGKEVCLLPKLYLFLHRNQSTSEDVYSKTNIGVCGMA